MKSISICVLGGVCNISKHTKIKFDFENEWKHNDFYSGYDLPNLHIKNGNNKDYVMVKTKEIKPSKGVSKYLEKQFRIKDDGDIIGIYSSGDLVIFEEKTDNAEYKIYYNVLKKNITFSDSDDFIIIDNSVKDANKKQIESKLKEIMAKTKSKHYTVYTDIESLKLDNCDLVNIYDIL